jgi:hypothetical protein
MPAIITLCKVWNKAIFALSPFLGRILIPPPIYAARRKGTPRLRCSMGRCSRRGSLKAAFRWSYKDAPFALPGVQEKRGHVPAVQSRAAPWTAAARRRFGFTSRKRRTPLKSLSKSAGGQCRIQSGSSITEPIQESQDRSVRCACLPNRQAEFIPLPNLENLLAE